MAHPHPKNPKVPPGQYSNMNSKAFCSFFYIWISAELHASPSKASDRTRARENLRYPGYGYISVVVNFLSRVIFILFQLHRHTLPYPKTKEKQKTPEIKKITTTYPSFPPLKIKKEVEQMRTIS